jgi:hypothetical protein
LRRSPGSADLAAATLAIALAACARERRVEAPVIEVGASATDGGARAPGADGPPPAEGHAPFDALAGRWVGIGRQDDGQTWPLQVEFTSGAGPGVCATAEYPTMPCRAEWVCLGEQGGVIAAHERLLDDSAQRCVDNGAMTLRPGPDRTIEWSWSGGGQTAEAKLHRAKRAPP